MAKQEPAAGGGTPSPPVPSAGQKEPKQDPHGLSGSMGGEGNLPDEKWSAKHEADAQAVETTQEPAAGGDAPSTPPVTLGAYSYRGGGERTNTLWIARERVEQKHHDDRLAFAAAVANHLRVAQAAKAAQNHRDGLAAEAAAATDLRVASENAY